MEYIKFISKDESGQGLVEYGLIIALIVLVAIIAVTEVGREIYYSLYINVTTKIGEIVAGF